MFTIENFCDVLKDMACVKEVILEVENDIPVMIVAGEIDGKIYHLKITNADFAEHKI